MARFDLRGDESQKLIISEAAKLNNQSLSQFMIESALTRAEIILSSRNYFELGEEQWAMFCEALDEKPKPVAELKQLFRKKTVLEK